MLVASDVKPAGYYGRLAKLRAEMPESDCDFEEYATAIERIADDPDAAPTARQTGLLRSYAVKGAMVGLANGGPSAVAVDAAFLRGAAC